VKHPGLLGILGLMAWFAGVAFTTTTSHYSGGAAVAIALLYGLLAAMLGLSAALLTRVGRLPALAGSAVVATVAVWHLREHTLVPESASGFALCASLATGIVWLAATRLVRAGPMRPLARCC
jgi:hypothetical protein